MMATYKGNLADGVLRVSAEREIVFKRGEPVELPEGLSLNPEQWEIQAPQPIEIKQPTINNEL